MPHEQGQRIEANCKIVWGNGDYDLTIETDDHVNWQCHVRRDYGTSLGHPLTMTGLCNSNERAWNELDRMLATWARQKQSERPMTKEQKLDIFGGPNGQNRHVLGQFLDEKKRREG